MAEKKPLRWRTVVRSLRPLVILLVVLTCVRSVVADWNDVPTGSMQPTILVGDRILVNKLAYSLKVPYTTRHVVWWDQPQRGEIIVFFAPTNHVRMVKRVVAVPGDVVAMADNVLLINGQRADYQPLASGDVDDLDVSQRQRSELFIEHIDQSSRRVMSQRGLRAMRSFESIDVPEGHYYVLGDNRDNSADSRYLGLIPIENIVGRSSCVVLSLDHDHRYLPRWGRLFSRLD